MPGPANRADDQSKACGEFGRFSATLGIGLGGFIPATLSIDKCSHGATVDDRDALRHHSSSFDPSHESHQSRISYRSARLHNGCRIRAIAGRGPGFTANQPRRWRACKCKFHNRLGCASCRPARKNDGARLAAADRQGLFAQRDRDIRQCGCALHEVGRLPIQIFIQHVHSKEQQ